MIFRIMTILPVNKVEKQKMLEINGFDQRLKHVNQIVKEKLVELQDKKIEFENNKSKVEEEKNHVIKRFLLNKGLTRGGERRNSNDDEIALLRTNLEECKLPEETQKLVDSELKKVESLDPRN